MQKIQNIKEEKKLMMFYLRISMQAVIVIARQVSYFKCLYDFLNQISA